uniref:MICOS complex subunit MIC13 n=1 Tax=Meleagris gallopavo TaxID=9103 RepID=A0A803Y441_MELGA
ECRPGAVPSACGPSERELGPSGARGSAAIKLRCWAARCRPGFARCCCASHSSGRFVIKGSLAGAAVYVAYDQGLLGSGAEGAEALKKAQAALPPAVREWTSYVGWELPPTPSLDFSPSDSWNKVKLYSASSSLTQIYISLCLKSPTALG